MPYTELTPDHIIIPGASEHTNKLANQLKQQATTLAEYSGLEIMNFNAQSIKLLRRAVITAQNMHCNLRESIVAGHHTDDPAWKHLDTEVTLVISYTMQCLDKRTKELEDISV